MTFEELLQRQDKLYHDTGYHNTGIAQIISKLLNKISKSDIRDLNDIVSNFNFNCRFDPIGPIILELYTTIDKKYTLRLQFTLDQYDDSVPVMYELDLQLRDQLKYFFSRRDSDFSFIYDCFLEFINE